MRASKRAFDLAGASLGLLFLSPLLLVLSLLVKLEDSGPVFFRHERVGRDGGAFHIIKFRTMVAGATGPSITVDGDPRVTRVGRFLRHWKLDELPQLINVVKGEMSLVGPRPEVPVYVARYEGIQTRVLDLVPGITDPASLAFRREGELLAGVADPERHYVREIMPEKIRMNLEYADRATLWSDLVVIVRTVMHLHR